jgi:hypothetical protein
VEHLPADGENRGELSCLGANQSRLAQALEKLGPLRRLKRKEQMAPGEQTAMGGIRSQSGPEDGIFREQADAILRGRGVLQAKKGRMQDRQKRIRHPMFPLALERLRSRRGKG